MAQKRGIITLVVLLTFILLSSTALTSAFSFTDWFKSIFSGKESVNANVINGVSSDGLIAHYSFSDSSNSNSGNLAGRASVISDGVGGKALSLDGASYSSSSTIFSGNAVSVSAWFMLKSTPNGMAVVSKPLNGPPWSYPYLSLLIRINSQNSIETDIGSNNVYSGSTFAVSSLNLNQWNHVAMTYDGSTIKAYLNGANIGSKGYNTGIFYNNNLPMLIGADYSGSPAGDYFNGLIDEVVIYNRALSESEITTAYNNQKAMIVSSSSASSSGSETSPSAPAVVPLPPPVQQACTDSDNGKNYLVKGQVIFNGTKYDDICNTYYKQNDSVKEYYCRDNKVQIEIAGCANGCKDGACIKENKTIQQCSDSDVNLTYPDGMNYGLRGITKGNFAGIHGEFVDSCTISGNILREYYCDSSNNVKIENVACIDCRDGSCKTEMGDENIQISVATIKDEYQVGEKIELTDPPENINEMPCEQLENELPSLFTEEVKKDAVLLTDNLIYISQSSCIQNRELFESKITPLINLRIELLSDLIEKNPARALQVKELPVSLTKKISKQTLEKSIEKREELEDSKNPIHF